MRKMYYLGVVILLFCVIVPSCVYAGSPFAVKKIRITRYAGGGFNPVIALIPRDTEFPAVCMRASINGTELGVAIMHEPPIREYWVLVPQELWDSMDGRYNTIQLEDFTGRFRFEKRHFKKTGETKLVAVHG